MEAVTWSLVGLLGATTGSLLVTLFRLSAKIEDVRRDLSGEIQDVRRDLGGRIDAQTRQIDAQTARIDAQTARIDALSSRMESHIHPHAG